MGKAIVLTDCNFSASNIGRVTFLSTSPSEPSEPGVTLINNNITFSISETSVYATLDYNANSALTINLSGLGQIVILAGNNEGSLKFDSSTSERTATISISPTSDSKYRYVSIRTSLTIPALQTPIVPTSLIIVGNREAAGSLGAGEYFILNTDTMKIVTSNASPASDEEYYGAITWSTDSSAAMLNNMGSYASLDISANGNVNVNASIGGQSISPVSVECAYSAADYQLSTFDDLKAVETAINNSTESSIALTSASGRTATNGSGFSGFTFLLLNDIDCNGSHVEIGYKNSAATKSFKGTIDGGCKALKNIGGNCGAAGSSSEGGKIGNCLVGYGDGCTIRNINLIGSVTNIASRGFATMIGTVNGSCTITNVYCNVNVSQATGITSGCVLISGWADSTGSKAYLRDVVYNGTFKAKFSISGLAHACASLVRCAVLGKLTYDAASRKSGVLTGFTTDTITPTLSYSVAACDITSGSSSEKLSFATNSTAKYCYESCVLNTGSAYKGFSSGTSLESYSVNGLSGAASAQKDGLYSKLASVDGYITREGWLPILFNRMARIPSVLNSAKL